ncbi:NYN domain-containing protein [Campylobacter helveticus]|uniref:NYN domain-containing protein n=1 Tax=Campylobacter helveticus TaxID=28898 RepID=A0AAX2ULG3_9BACT|nr:NYN domain-containing protein [Campylobacter helveticus]ELU1350227.1 NYN domain-containing protein [Campylobacter jejuni]ARE81383.1 LabA family protein [Campylobacter helveticus]MCR2039857.1 NYN domain-containing protein [Campylobacter helveticus]MCR2060303.1 NYN domain-containing protein [Campylobacter helveticus]MCR2062065.1 NYN domain-containing protein [Campylobacter helveticus]
MKIAVFVDWENLRKDIENIQRKHEEFKEKFDYNNAKQVANLIKSFVEEDEKLYRIFFYTARPLDLTIRQKDNNLKWLEEYMQINKEQCEKMSKITDTIQKFIKDISFEEYFALRLGELKLQGKDDSNRLIINQKQVDMLLGLDISHIAYNKLVDSILVFCKDSDMLPALKCARINGLNVFIAHIQNGFKITEKLKVHSDKIRIKSVESILKKQAI